MNNQEFNEVFKLLLVAYPNTKDKESVATIYFLTIANELTKKEFAEAVVKILKTRKSGFIPQPAEILEVAKKTANIEHQVILAKKMLKRAIEKVGRTGMIAFEDKGVQAVVDYASWLRLCDMSETEFDNFMNWEFEKIYKEFMKNPYNVPEYFRGSQPLIGQTKPKLFTYAMIGIRNNENFIPLEYNMKKETENKLSYKSLKEKMLVGG
jgi:hypothetical protein|nr:MAG TPA: Loader and inhibitor of phage G40P [Caudoviricetes sp.]